MYHSKKIGIFVSHIYGTYQKNLCQGIVDKATEFGYLVEIFASNDGENFGSYGLGENSILNIPNFEDFSGVIVATGTYVDQNLMKQLLDTLKSQCHCPIIEVNNTSTTPYSCVGLDNNSPARQLMEHLISVHNYKRICFLGNTEEEEPSQIRYHYYTQSMDAHKLPLWDYHYFQCAYSETEVDAALEYFMKNETPPEAIVCYNDRMALLMMHSLSKRGLRVPEDIALTGFDVLEDGQNNVIPLTSVTFPSYEQGIAAVENLIKLTEKNEVPAMTIVEAEPLIGHSCGCTKTQKKNIISYGYHLRQKVETMEASLIDNIHMSANLQDVSDLDIGMDLLEKYVGNIENCKEFYLCLYSKWDSASKHIRELTQGEEEELPSSSMLLKLGINNGKRLAECLFTKCSALPEYVYSSASTYVYSPLFFGKQAFGYVAIAFEGNQLAYEFNLINWFMNVNSMLKNICDNKNMRLLVDRLEDIYMRDDLTNHYNRQGFHALSQRLTETALREKKALLAMIFNLDGLKKINNNFGYKEGNFAIQVLGQALEIETGGEIICARTDGDKFQILMLGRSTKDAVAYVSKVERYLENHNRLNTKEFSISASCGYVVEVPEVGFDLQELFQRASEELVANKVKI